MVACLSWAGRDADSLHYARQFVRETVQAFGAQSLEMASALEFFAGSALNAESLQEAAEAVGRAGEIAKDRSMRATSRIRLAQMQAIIENNLGHHDVARLQLLDLLNQPAPWYERASQWRALASAEAQLGHLDDAMRAADSAIRAMPPDWDRTAQASLARMLWGTAASKAGRHTEALAALDRARIDLAAAGYSDSAPASLFMRRYEAEALLRAGRTAEAAASLAALSRDHELTSPRQTGEAGRLALSLGCAQAMLGQRDVATRHFDVSARLLAEALPADHPLQRRIAELRDGADCSRLL
jgi:tetratricopeptide (TPR) repeat protein